MKDENVKLLNIRWFIENCMEIHLPCGKTIVIDPMLINNAEDTDSEIAKSYVTAYSSEDLEGCDYILLTHIHGDHIGSLKQVHKRFPNAPILVNGWSAFPLAKYMDLPLGAFIPMTDGETYRFDGFEVKWLQGRHTAAIGARTPKETIFGDEEESYITQMGTIYNSNFIISLDNGIRLAMDGGRYEPNLSNLKYYRPNVVFCHSMRDLEENGNTFLDVMERSGAEYLFPLTAQILGDNIEKAAEIANEKLRSARLEGKVLAPKSGQWMRFSMCVASVDD